MNLGVRGAILFTLMIFAFVPVANAEINRSQAVITAFKAANPAPGPGSEWHVDHVIPLARGGRSEKNNLVACCKECNTRKKTSLPQEWDDYLQGFSER